MIFKVILSCSNYHRIFLIDSILKNKQKILVRCSHGSSSGLKDIIVPNRSYLKVSGKDTRKFLQGLCTNDISKLNQKGMALATAFLNSKGRILADTIMYDLSEDHISPDQSSIVIEVHMSLHQNLISFLKLYKLRSSVVIETVQYQTVIEFQPNDNKINKQMILRTTDPRSSTLGTRVLYPFNPIDNSTSSGSGTSSSSTSSIESSAVKDYDRYRYKNGLPEGLELVDHIPLESNLDLLNYISFTKGCYIGQELTARTKFKGLVRKRMVPFCLVSSSGENLKSINNIHSITVEMNADNLTVTTNATNNDMPKREDLIVDLEPATSSTSNTNEPIGKIIAFRSSCSMGIAMVKLDSLFSNKLTRLAIRRSDSTVVHSYNIRLFKPLWWPDIDPQTGKKLDEITSS